MGGIFITWLSISGPPIPACHGATTSTALVYWRSRGIFGFDVGTCSSCIITVEEWPALCEEYHLGRVLNREEIPIDARRWKTQPWRQYAKIQFGKALRKGHIIVIANWWPVHAPSGQPRFRSVGLKASDWRWCAS